MDIYLEYFEGFNYLYVKKVHIPYISIDISNVTILFHINVYL
jgi:hypothetical protein